MPENTYSDRELDGKFDSLHDKLDTIYDQTRFTNGKVRKIIIALVLIGGIVIGQTATNMHEILALLSSVV